MVAGRRSLPLPLPPGVPAAVLRLVLSMPVNDVIVAPPWRRWLPVVVWTATIWAAIPVMRALQQLFTRFLPKEAIGWFVLAAIAGGAIVAAVAVRRARGRIDPITVAIIAGTGTVLAVWTVHLWREPAEAFHFVQYGVLGVLLFRALRPVRPDLSSHLAAAVAGLLLGTVDEVLQWLTPGRFWDLRDIVINGSAATLVQPALWRLAPPVRPLRPRALRLPLALVAAELILLTLCFSATPARLERLADRIPSLAYLTTLTNTMAEYGHLHTIPGVGSFRSRLTRAELDELDRTRSADVAAILDRYPPSKYGRFLRDVRPGVDPFVYEARVHIFARDANWAEALKLEPGSPARRRRMTVALREQQILETVFGRTLTASIHATPSGAIEQARAEMDPDLAFTSRAGAHLIVGISEPRLRLLLLAGAALAGLGALALRSGRTTPATGGGT